MPRAPMIRSAEPVGIRDGPARPVVQSIRINPPALPSDVSRLGHPGEVATQTTSSAMVRPSGSRPEGTGMTTAIRPAARSTLMISSWLFTVRSNQASSAVT